MSQCCYYQIHRTTNWSDAPPTTFKILHHSCQSRNSAPSTNILRLRSVDVRYDAGLAF